MMDDLAAAAQGQQMDMLLDWLGASDAVGNPAYDLPPLQGTEDAMMDTQDYEGYEGQSIAPATASSVAFSTQFCPQTPPSPVISQISGMLASQRGVIDRLRRAQREAVTSPSIFAPTSLAALQSLFQQIELVVEELQRITMALQGLRVQQMLSFAEDSTVCALMDSVNLHSAQLSLYRTELEYIQRVVATGQSNPVPSLVSLVITSSPFPAVWMKRTQLADGESIHVQMLTATGVQLLEVAALRPHLISSNPALNQQTKPAFDTESIPIDPTTISAILKPTFLRGTRKNVAQIRFSVQMRYAVLYGGALSSHSITTEVSSAESAPFVVVTNESQFNTALATLFHRDTFHYYWGHIADHVPWSLYSNLLQSYFLKSTKQAVNAPLRPLSTQDLLYFHHHFFQRATNIDSNQSTKFWEWFGAVLQKLRHQRSWLSMFTSGLIFGFATRFDVVQELIGMPVGTALLRFSETSAGSISMVFRTSTLDQTVKHYLIKHEDISSSSRSLADFILTRPEISFILQLTNNLNNAPVFKLLNKQCLQVYSIPKVGQTQILSPYDDL